MNDIEVKCFGFAEQRVGDSMYGFTGFTYIHSFPEPFLPTRGQYIGGRYQFSLSFNYGETLPEEDLEKEIGETTSVIEFNCETDSIINNLGYEEPISKDRYGLSRGSYRLGETLTRPEAVPWYDDSEWSAADDCYVRLQTRYDAGLTVSNNSRPEYMDEVDQQWSYETMFSELGLTVDYRGRITGTDNTVRLPMQISYALPLDDCLVAVLDHGSSGVANPTVDIPPERNVVCVDPSGDVRWIVEAFDNGTEGPSKHRAICWNGTNIVTDVYAGDAFYLKVSPDTGDIVQAMLKS